MKIAPFGVEIWMNDYETRCRYNLAETCTESLTVDELLVMTNSRETLMEQLLPMKLTYGAIEGSDRLRAAIAALYQSQTPQNVLVTHGAIGANSLAHQALLSSGDHVVSVVPAYQQHYSIPEAIGAVVDKLRMREDNGFMVDVDELAELVRPDTKLICLTNPNNPTGALLGEAELRRIVEVAERCGAYVLCDEVYRGTDDHDPGTSPSIADLYERGISTSSVSKAFSLAGLRLGWIAGPRDVIADVAIHRDYTTISVGMINDMLASLALEHADAVLGTTALLRYDLDRSSRQFCVDLIEQEGVLLTPGSAMDMEGYLRIGYVGNREELIDGLPKISAYLHR
ncbi:MAG TPA: aminotransferase class I/II-fold pyridoxal phosphate-dependent enzyme [Mycobacterium sp.]